MSSPTRRDEAWHAILTTCAETGVQDTFKKGDVADVADELGLGVSERTIIKALGVMVDFGYLQREEEQRAYRLDPSVVAGFGRWADEIVLDEEADQ